ncbi:hypothetical protein BDB00DRAFT_824677 [Zychaea mexicana]|uniref:uncharacterized protein n=1 Tax=Zychaea mexicana TaxID=64656 RepID=UPI0022FDCFDD|nr:uncharacterized protein BDB00DRAFT_824677 [Zychaea mexicana]KAI9493172.1 hypothetical protein BDB00DRAFT_824677 [Zychaea mexicana]
MVSSSPFNAGRSLKNLFKDNTNARSSNVSLNSEPTPSASGPSRRMSLSASSSSHHSNKDHSNKNQTRHSSAQSEPSLHDRPLPTIPPSPTQPRSSSRPPVSKHNNKRKESTPFYKRFSRVPSVDDDLKEAYTAYLYMENASVNNESSTSSSQHHNQQHKHQQSGPPEPPTHSLREDSASVHSGSSGNNNNNSNNNNGSSSSNSSGAGNAQQTATKKKIPKSAVQKHRVTRLVSELDELKLSRDKESLELESRYHKLQHTLDAKEAELNRISANFHKHVMTIRATDDDFSTIRVKLTMLQSKISALPLSLKKYAADRTVITRYFTQCWPALMPTIDQLSKKNGALDYNIICLFVEKLVTEELIASVYSSPIMIGLPTNDAFMQIKEYMEPHDRDWALRLRQQMCKLAVKSLNTNEAAAKPIASAKNDVVERLTKKLSHIYSSSEGHQALVAKIAKFVDLACELSAAMHSQENPVDPIQLVEGEDKLNDELVVPQNGSADNATIVRVVVCPPFTASEKQDNDIVLMKGKVICL